MQKVKVIPSLSVYDEFLPTGCLSYRGYVNAQDQKCLNFYTQASSAERMQHTAIRSLYWTCTLQLQ